MEIVEGKDKDGKDWNAKGNHDSSYSFADVRALVEQAANVAPLADVNKMPERIGLFVRHCLNGERPITVCKGIHQRWKDIKKDGVVSKEANPHIQVAFSHRFGKSKEDILIRIHICLSQKPQGLRVIGKGNGGRQVVTCAWQTVGVTSQRQNLQERYPAVFVQTVDDIQQQAPGRGGLKRRHSVGLLVAENE